MSAVAEFGEIRIEGNAMVSEESILVGKRIKLLLDLLELIIEVWVLGSQTVLTGFVVRVELANGFELVQRLVYTLRRSKRDTYMFFRAMDVDIEILRRMKLFLQPRMLLWRMSNVYRFGIWAQGLANALSSMMGAFVDCDNCSAGLVSDLISCRRH